MNTLLLEKTLTASERKELKPSQFGLPDTRSFPIHDEAHIRSAMHYFKFCPDKSKKELARNIAKAAKQHGVHISPDSLVAKYLSKENLEETK